MVSGDAVHYLGGNEVTLYAPYRVTLTNYAIEAEARLLQPLADYQDFGLVFRGYNCCGAGVTTTGDCSGNVSAWIDRSFGDEDCTATSMDQAWHDYRVEVQGNRATLSIDGAIVNQVTNNNYLYLKRSGYQFNGSVGLEMQGVQADIRVFKVFALG